MRQHPNILEVQGEAKGHLFFKMFHFKGITIDKTFKSYFFIVIPWYSTDMYWVSWREKKEKRLGDLKNKNVHSNEFFLNDSPFMIENLYLITCCPNTVKKLHQCFTKDVLDTLIFCWPLTLHLQQILSSKYVEFQTLESPLGHYPIQWKCKQGKKLPKKWKKDGWKWKMNFKIDIK